MKNKIPPSTGAVRAAFQFWERNPLLSAQMHEAAAAAAASKSWEHINVIHLQLSLSLSSFQVSIDAAKYERKVHYSHRF